MNIFIGIGIVTLVGIMFFIIGLAMLNNRMKKEKNCTVKTNGKVIDIVKEKSNDTQGYTYYFHPVFEYNIGELKFVKKSSIGTSEQKYAIGQDVEILYNPENYHEYYVVGDNKQKRLAIIFTIVGIIVIIISIFSALMYFNKN